LNFDLKVGFSCNNDCIHCVVADKRETKDLSTQELKDIILNIPKNSSVIFTGGEPTIRQDFIELCKFTKDLNHMVILQTNGTMFSSEEFTQETAKYLDDVLIAIHSFDENTHNKIVRCRTEENMYNKTIEGFKNLIKYNIRTNTQTVISKLNIETLPETYRFIQSIAPKIRMNLTFPHPMGAAYVNHDLVVPKYSEIKPYIQTILKEYGKYLYVEAIPICYLYPYQDICYSGDMHLLEKKAMGMDPANKNSKLFDENGITNDYRINDLSSKRKAKKCYDCIYTNKCVGVWQEYIEFYKDSLDLFPIKNDYDIINKFNGISKNITDIIIDEPNNIESEIKKIIKDGYTSLKIICNKNIDNILLLDEYLNNFNNIQLDMFSNELISEKTIQFMKNFITFCKIPLLQLSDEHLHNNIINCSNQDIQIIGDITINELNKDIVCDIIDSYIKDSDYFMKEINIKSDIPDYDFTEILNHDINKTNIKIRIANDM
jgi:MoaA/NifB/PqqE/SkfB family radical SAM enzyme